MNIKFELKIFFTVWLCLSFFLSPIMIGAYLTPKIVAPQAQAVLPVTDWAHIGTAIVNYIKNAITSSWQTAQDWARDAVKWATENAWELAKSAAKAALKVLLHQILAQITNSIIKWIQSDFQGQPGFVTDWKSYLAKAADAAAGRFLNDLAGANLCSPFKLKVQVAISTPTADFKTGAACTLDGILANVNATIDDFYNDFTKGGWLAFENSLKPNNNAFGAFLMAQDAKIALQFAEMQKKDKETKSGFKGTKKCLSATSSAQVSNLEANASSCATLSSQISAGPGGTISQEQYNATVEAYEQMCTGTSAPVTSGDVATIDPDSADCKSSITTAPDGTVSYSTNFSSVSAMRVLQNEIANLVGEGTGAEFTPYITAITNALITQLVKDGVNGLLGAVAEEENTDPNTNTIPTSTNSDVYASITTDAAAAQRTLSNLSQMTGDGIVGQNKKEFDKILTTVKSIRDKQNAIINDFWGQGDWGSAASTITSGPTTTTSGNSTTEYTIYKISQSEVGEANIGKTVITTFDPSAGTSTTTTSYSIIAYRNQIEDIDGVVTSYQNQVNDLAGLIAVAPALKSATDTFISAASAYASAWQQNPTTADPTAAQTARNNLISQLQNATGSTTISLSELNTALENIINGTTTDTTGIMITITNPDGSTSTELASSYYQDYYNQIASIYNSLQPQVWF